MVGRLTAKICASDAMQDLVGLRNQLHRGFERWPQSVSLMNAMPTFSLCRRS
jgi:hypothetical protein